MGQAPATCFNPYPFVFKSFIINNGTGTFDALSHPGIMFNVYNDASYNVTFVVHTANANLSGNTSPTGTIWYDTDAPNGDFGYCANSKGEDTVSLGGVGPNQDVRVSKIIDRLGNQPNFNHRADWWSYYTNTLIFYHVNYMPDPVIKSVDSSNNPVDGSSTSNGTIQGQSSSKNPVYLVRSNAELNRLIDKIHSWENSEAGIMKITKVSMIDTIEKANPLPVDIPSATGSLYELVNDDPIGVANVMTAVQVGGIDWNSLSEGQKLYMYEVLQYGQPASTNTASISDIPSTNLSGVPLGATGSKITYKSFYDIVSADPVGVANAMNEIESSGMNWNYLTDAQKSYLVLIYEYGLPVNEH